MLLSKDMIYLAADHRGFKLKEATKDFLLGKGYEIEDLGAVSYNKDDDYADFAALAAEKIAEKPEVHKGIFICGSGHGMDMVANKFEGVRAALGFNAHVVAQAREHENANVLILASDWLKPDEALGIVMAWLGKSFSGEERHARRLQKIEKIEEKNFK